MRAERAIPSPTVRRAQRTVDSPDSPFLYGVYGLVTSGDRPIWGFESDVLDKSVVESVTTMGAGPDGHLRFDVRAEADATVVAIEGEIDLYTSPEIREQVGGLARPGRNVVIDLTDVGFLDSTGLGSLVWARKRVQQDGGELVVVGPQPHIRRVLEISGVSRVVPIEGFPPPD